MSSPTPEDRSFGQKIWRFPLVRLLLGIAIVGLATALMSGALSLLGELLLAEAESVGWFLLLRAVLSAAMALFFYYLYVRYVERREPTEVSLHYAGRELGTGILIGAGLFILVIGTIWLFGYYQVTDFNGFGGVWFPLASAVTAGVIEEIIFRALLFRIFERWLGSWMSLAFSALFFGFAHAGNEGATLFSNVAIALEAGILLAAVYMYTQRIWMAIGLHFAWNFVQGGIFDVAVSGNEQTGVLEATLTGPELLAGGDFGAEATVFALAFCLAAAILFLRSSRVKIFPAPWQAGYQG